MRKTVIVASVMVAASMAMPSMAHAKDKPPVGSNSHIGKCKGHVVNPDMKSKGHDNKSTEEPTKSDKADKGLNNKTLNTPGLNNHGMNNQSLISGLIIRCR
jgi:hypothetical protein